MVFIEKLRRGDFGSNLVTIFRSIASSEITGTFDGEIVPLLPPLLKFITQNGAGYDNIDVAACTACGIRVSYTPHAKAGQPVATTNVLWWARLC